ncbi:hypothetical protein BGX34_005997 [Mortierella sp. NVP85]|nr:hypothetical protein BGX34_005997 [Mortierella sp. NVP85]
MSQRAASSSTGHAEEAGPSTQRTPSATAGTKGGTEVDAPIVGFLDRKPSSISSSSSHHPDHSEGAGVGGAGAGAVAGAGAGEEAGNGNGSGSSSSSSSGSSGNNGDAGGKSKHHQRRQTLLTKALLGYLRFFRVAQPLASVGALGTITPVLRYFKHQTLFPKIQATLYVFTATLACCSLFFSIIYLMDVMLRKPLFWPFTNRHFRRSSKARIGGDLIVCMVFCGLWFLSMVGLVIDSVWVDCTRLTGLEPVFKQNHRSVNSIKTVCRLEKATLGLAVVSWACWAGVLLVLLYGHFWKRRQVIAARLRDRLSRRHRARTEREAAGVSSAVPDAGTGQAGSAISGRNGVGNGNSNSNSAGAGGVLNGGTINSVDGQHSQQPSERACQQMEGEVGLTGIICRYDDEHSSINHSIGRSAPPHSHVAS